MSLKDAFQKFKKYVSIPFMGYYKPDTKDKPLVTIPLIDIRESSPLALFDARKKETREMIVKSRQTFGWISRLLAPIITPITDFLSRRWLRKSKNPYAAEIKEAAKKIRRTGTYTLNMCYEWGCTSGAYATGNTATLTRVQDWPLPLMGENLVVAHQKGTAGDFYNVTWPGYAGVVHAMAPGRFAAALNKAPGRRSGRNGMRDWFHNRLKIGRRRALPPPHLLRQAFEKAANYEEAKQMLLTGPLTMPAIFILSGVNSNEGCVIERTEDRGIAREMTNGSVVAANHFETGLNGIGDGWRSRVGPGQNDCLVRSEYAKTIPAEKVTDKEGFAWFTGSPLSSVFCRVVMTADAATGTMRLMGTGGAKPVTEIFKIGTGSEKPVTESAKPG